MKKMITGMIALIFSIASPIFACGNKQLETNKQTVTKFYDAVINKKDFPVATKYLGDVYVQHNPNAADGKEGLKQFIQFLRDKYPNAHSEIKQVFADGNYVILHVYSIREPDTRGRAIFDLFKLKNGKIVEHWDAVQDIPEKSANNNTMF